MSKKSGYILLHKRIENNFLWDEKPFDRARAWIDLLMMANWTDTEKILKGQLVKLKRGQLVRGLSTLADRWGWSVGKVQRYLKMLENQKMCNVIGYPFGQLITIENYERYQDGRYENDQSDEQPDEQPDEQQINNNKRIIKKVAPTAAEIYAYFSEHGYVSDPEQFMAYYESTDWTKKNGQPISSWKSAAIAWERREKEFNKNREQSGSNVTPIEPPKYREFEPEPEIDAEPADPELMAEMKKKLTEAIT